MRAVAEVLSVDDDRLFLEMVRDTLTGAGFSVESVSSGELAVENIAKQAFDVVVTDLHMPGLGGEDVLAFTREHSPESEVIVLTGKADLDSAISCLRLGAFDIVRKEKELPELVPAVQRALERRELRMASALHEVSRLIFASQDRVDLPERIVRIASQVMRADDASLMLVDVNGELYVAFSNGLPKHIQLIERTLIGDGIAGKIASQRKPVIIQGDRTGGPAPNQLSPIPDRGVRSSIVYPLVSGDSLLGVLNLNRISSDRRPFRPADLTQADLLASQIVLALENQQLIRRVTAADKFLAVGQLSTAIAHEINNPISYVLGGIDIVIESLGNIDLRLAAPQSGEPLDALGGPGGVRELCEILKDAREGAIRISEVVRDLRHMVRDEHDGKHPFNLSDAVRTATRLSMAELRSIAELELNLSSAVFIEGSRGAMAQVFVNVFINAAQAMRGAGMKSGRLTVDSSVQDGQALVVVTDTGPGIPPEQQARIFEPFFTTKPAGVGTGLGLSTCRDIVAWHGGTMRVRSKVGEGTTFRISLPAMPESEARAAISRAGRVDRDQEEDMSIAGSNILVVDDEQAIGRTLTRMMKYCRVTAVHDGDKALELMRLRQDFNLVLCDVVMPGMSGVDVYACLEEERNPLISRFFFMTGSVGFANVSEYAKEKGIEVIEKPVTHDTILSVLRRVMNGG